MSAALCIDLGGTNMRAGLASPDGPTAPELIFNGPAPSGLDAFRDSVAGLLAKHAVTRLGIAIPGLANGTVCAWVPNLPYLDGADLASLFPGIDIALGNDAHFALLAESAAGTARDLRHALLLAIGTGIGSAVLADGRIVRGAGGGATSFGWACAELGDPGDEAHGWLERNAAGRALDGIAATLGLQRGPALIAAAQQGNETARECLRQPAEALGVTLAGAVALLGSEAVIISGGVADGLDVLAPFAEPAMRRHLPPHLRAVSLRAATFGPGASLAGAGLAAHGHPTWFGGKT